MNYKISFCTVCMNRLDHLKETLPKNIEDTLPYHNFEFVVLDYNSNDGLEKWIQKYMTKYLKTGKLVYFKTTLPQYFRMSHSKNMVAKKATGDIICNVDADNFVGKGFANYINEKFFKKNNIYLAVKKNFVSTDFYGRICVFKKDFLAVTGYDENMTEYGFEDFDFRNRLDMLGLNVNYISNKKFFKAITHSVEKRIEKGSYVNNIEQILIQYINHYSSELLYLFKNGNYIKGKVLINRLVNSSSTKNVFSENRKSDSLMVFENDLLHTGRWFKYGDALTLKNEEGQIHFQVNDNKVKEQKNGSVVYHECHETEKIQEAIMFLSQSKNYLLMLENKKNKRIRVNKFFGEI